MADCERDFQATASYGLPLVTERGDPLELNRFDLAMFDVQVFFLFLFSNTAVSRWGGSLDGPVGLVLPLAAYSDGLKVS